MVELSHMVNELQHSTLDYLINSPENLERIATRWSTLDSQVRDQLASGQLPLSTIEQIHRCAINISAAGQAVLEFESYSGRTCNELSQTLVTVLEGSNCGPPVSDPREETTPSQKCLGSPITDLNKCPNDHLRLWFLEHIAFPYPTPNEKDDISNLTGLARTKIDSDLTNWRRRAGWTEIKDTYARGSRKDMQTLMERVEAGTERNKAVLEAVESMRAYLERREEEKVGDWVKEITSITQPAKRAKRSNGTPRITSESSLPEYDDLPSSLSGQSSYGSLSAVSSVIGPRTRSRPSRGSGRSISSSSNWSVSSEAGQAFSFSPTERVASGVSDISMALVPSQNSRTQISKRSLPSDMELDEPEHPSIRMKSESSSSSPSEPQWYTPPTGSPTEYISTTSLYPQPGPAPMQMPHYVPVYAPPHTAPINPYTVDASIQSNQGPMDSPTSIHDESQGSMWSTATSLPVLPHMMNRGGNGFQMPTSWDFKPQFAWGQ